MKKSVKLNIFFLVLFVIGALILILLRVYHKIPDFGFIGGSVVLSFYLIVIVFRIIQAEKRERGKYYN